METYVLLSLCSARKVLVDEKLKEAEESNFTSKEMQATIKIIDKNIEMARHHRDKVLELRASTSSKVTDWEGKPFKPFEQWLLEDVLEFIRYDEDWFLETQKRMEMLCVDRDDIKIRQNNTIQDVINELKLWEQVHVKDLHFGDQICYKDRHNKIYVGIVAKLEAGKLKFEDKAGKEHRSTFVADTKICWRKSKNADEENAELEHLIEIIKDLKI